MRDDVNEQEDDSQEAHSVATKSPCQRLKNSREDPKTSRNVESSSDVLPVGLWCHSLHTESQTVPCYKKKNIQQKELLCRERVRVMHRGPDDGKECDQGEVLGDVDGVTAEHRVAVLP
mmetsp:Transcript_38280/g.75198  ORF Transcript_38280/g.75198 Transcript_38280/m.75198 type:complete len:118 (+) Transcript_38280:634-987(+)